MLRARAKGWRDERRRLQFVGAGAQGDDRVLVQVMLGSQGDPDGAILRRSFDRAEGEPAAAMADRLLASLTSGAFLDDEPAHRQRGGVRRH